MSLLSLGRTSSSVARRRPTEECPSVRLHRQHHLPWGLPAYSPVDKNTGPDVNDRIPPSSSGRTSALATASVLSSGILMLATAAAGRSIGQEQDTTTTRPCASDDDDGGRMANPSMQVMQQQASPATTLRKDATSTCVLATCASYYSDHVTSSSSSIKSKNKEHCAKEEPFRMKKQVYHDIPQILGQQQVDDSTAAPPRTAYARVLTRRQGAAAANPRRLSPQERRQAIVACQARVAQLKAARNERDVSISSSRVLTTRRQRRASALAPRLSPEERRQAMVARRARLAQLRAARTERDARAIQTPTVHFPMTGIALPFGPQHENNDNGGGANHAQKGRFAPHGQGGRTLPPLGPAVPAAAAVSATSSSARVRSIAPDVFGSLGQAATPRVLDTPFKSVPPSTLLHCSSSSSTSLFARPGVITHVVSNTAATLHSGDVESSTWLGIRKDGGGASAALFGVTYDEEEGDCVVPTTAAGRGENISSVTCSLTSPTAVAYDALDGDDRPLSAMTSRRAELWSASSRQASLIRRAFHHEEPWL